VSAEGIGDDGGSRKNYRGYNNRRAYAKKLLILKPKKKTTKDRRLRGAVGEEERRNLGRLRDRTKTPQPVHGLFLLKIMGKTKNSEKSPLRPWEKSWVGGSASNRIDLRLGEDRGKAATRRAVSSPGAGRQWFVSLGTKKR